MGINVCSNNGASFLTETNLSYYLLQEGAISFSLTTLQVGTTTHYFLVDLFYQQSGVYYPKQFLPFGPGLRCNFLFQLVLVKLIH